MIIEVMGRDAGWIALHSGMAGGADVILIPEIRFRVEKVAEKIQEREAAGRRFSLVVIAEGARLPGAEKQAPLAPGRGSRLAVGRNSQRSDPSGDSCDCARSHSAGGSPSPFDRILGTRFGSAAAHLVAEGGFGRMVCLRAGTIESVRLDEAVGVYRVVDPACDHVSAARGVGISFGDGA